MKKLLLLRHAKSSWDDQRLDDFARPLNARGRDAAPRMGREIARRGLIPSLILGSPARRTAETIELILPFLSPRPEVRFEPGFIWRRRPRS